MYKGILTLFKLDGDHFYNAISKLENEQLMTLHPIYL